MHSFTYFAIRSYKLLTVLMLALVKLPATERLMSFSQYLFQTTYLGRLLTDRHEISTQVWCGIKP